VRILHRELVAFLIIFNEFRHTSASFPLISLNIIYYRRGRCQEKSTRLNFPLHFMLQLRKRGGRKAAHPLTIPPIYDIIV
jgi:hypothetical protein